MKPSPPQSHFGTIQAWNADRGFGFIRPDVGGTDVFLHVKAWPAPSHPQPGERVQYRLTASGDGRPRAAHVHRLANAAATPNAAPHPPRTAARGRAAPAAGPQRQRAARMNSDAPAPKATRQRQSTRIQPFAHALMAVLLVLLAASSAWGHAPIWLAAVYGVMSVITFLVYAADKQAAQNDAWRVPEKKLLLLGLACGWPGALLAQQLLRHKSSKRHFLVPFWVTVALNLGALIWLSAKGLPTW